MPVVDAVNLMVWNQIRLLLPAGTVLSSVKRPASAQLAVIVSKASALGYKFARTPTVEDASSWQGALDFLRKKGFKIAAPGRSNHQSGFAYDFTGPDLQAIRSAIMKAAADGRITLANSRSALLIEHKNHCVHAEIVRATIWNEQRTDIHRFA